MARPTVSRKRQLRIRCELDLNADTHSRYSYPLCYLREELRVRSQLYKYEILVSGVEAIILFDQLNSVPSNLAYAIQPDVDQSYLAVIQRRERYNA